MAGETVRGQQEGSGTRVLPLRRQETRVPSPVLVAEALAGAGLAPPVIRSGVAVATALGGATSRPGAQGEDERVLAGELGRRAGLSAAEAALGIQGLRDAGLLLERSGGEWLQGDVLCALPVLSAIAWEGCRDSLEAAGARVAPALAVLRTVGRLSRPGRGEGGEWVVTSVQDLAGETLYGRTAVTQALGDLTDAGLLIRAAQPARKGLRVRIAGRAMGMGAGRLDEAGPAPAASGGVQGEAAEASRARAEMGVTVEVGGACVEVPAGSRLRLSAGMNYRLEIGPDGAATIRID